MMRLLSSPSIALLVISSCMLPLGNQAGTAPASTPPELLWRDPGELSSRDPFWGFGARERQPQGPYTFVEEDTDGTQAKVAVTDRQGAEWEVKFGAEAPAEVASNRFLWALGYLGEEMYLVRDGVIEGAKRLERAREHIGGNGRFRNARFRKRNPRVARTEDEWTFHDNPFLGTRELSGLVIVMNLINNWDIREARNNRVLAVRHPGGRIERWFIVSDLGATFGRMGGPLGQRSKWNLTDYLEEDFIESVSRDHVKLDYEGFGKGDLGRIPIEHARWFVNLASPLTLEQLRRVFEAAGATPREIDGYSRRLAEKMLELENAVRSVEGPTASRASGAGPIVPRQPGLLCRLPDDA